MCYEIVSLSRAKRIVIDLNDSVFINNFLKTLKLSPKSKDDLTCLINMKSLKEINDLLDQEKVSKKKIKEIFDLISLDGSSLTINRIKNYCKTYSYKAQKNIESLENISKKLKNLKGVSINFDLCSKKSMDYESGFNYSFYVDNLRKIDCCWRTI